MKIAQISCVFPPYKGGIGQVAKKYAEIALGYGHFSAVITSGKAAEEDDKKHGFSVIRLNSFLRYGNAAFLWQVFREIDKYDIIHLHYPFFGTDLVVWLKKILNKDKFKLALHYHMDVAGLPFYIRLFSLPSKMIFRSLVKNSDAATCASLDYLSSSDIGPIYEKYKEKFKEIPFGVDTDRFLPGFYDKDNSKLLFVGGLDKAHYFKGLKLLMRSLCGLKDVEWRLDIVGSGGLENKYKEISKNFGLEKNIRFLGGINNQELAEAYQGAAFLVLPSINKNEAFGLVILEAMACALPVLASDLPGVRSVFKDRREGVYFRNNNLGDLREKIRYMLKRPERLREMGRKGRALVEKKYDWRVIGKELNDFYENLLDK